MKNRISIVDEVMNRTFCPCFFVQFKKQPFFFFFSSGKEKQKEKERRKEKDNKSHMREDK
jgi:hypothetical protein